MLTIVVPGPNELYDEETKTFLEDESEAVTLTLEHSLISLSKWESIHEKAFLSNDDKTNAEIVSYVKCMTVTRNVPDEVYKRLSNDNVAAIKDYLDAPMTATWFSDKRRGRGSREVVTSEVIYYWMTALQIPFEVEKWHLNRLFTLIRVCDLKNSKPKKMSRAESASLQRELNEKRRKELGTSG
jgi:hypothetical protein